MQPIIQFAENSKQTETIVTEDQQVGTFTAFYESCGT